MTLLLHAMNFAMAQHATQVRRYTGEPYWKHLAEVAGIVSAAYDTRQETNVETVVATAWLHDVVEDCGVSIARIGGLFGIDVMMGVCGLSDLEEGNRAERKAASRERLSKCQGWVQDIKCADLISNTSSIVMHDPKFAVTYLEEKRLLLDVLTQANPVLLSMARAYIPPLNSPD